MLEGSFGEFVETVWWPRTKPGCTRETLRRYTGIVETHLERFNGLLLEDIRLEIMQPWVSGFDLSAKTVHNIFGVLSGILELARKVGRYSRLDHKLVSLPTIKRKKREGLEIARIKKIIKASKGTELEGPVWVAAYLGLRRNEVCGLKRGHVSIKGDTAVISIQDNRQPHGETKKLKSKPEGEPRVLHVPKWMGEKVLSFADPDSIYLFCSSGKPIHPNKLTCGMPTICKKADPKADPIRFHDLRHACRSNLSAAGVPEVVIMSVLGHTDYQASLGYQDDRPARQSEAFDRLASL